MTDLKVNIPLVVFRLLFLLHFMMFVSHNGDVSPQKPSTCCGCNDTGQLYQACPMRRSWQEKAPISIDIHVCWLDITCYWVIQNM